jgi:hypothetical protein
MGRGGVPSAAGSKSTRQTPPHGAHTPTRDLRHPAHGSRESFPNLQNRARQTGRIPSLFNPDLFMKTEQASLPAVETEGAKRRCFSFS